MITALTTGLLLGLAAGLAPGPLLTLIISHALRYGVGEGIKVALSPFITDLPIILAAVWLVSFFHATPWPMGLLALAGAVYVASLAWKSARVKAVELQDVPENAKSLLKGSIVNLLNPHPWIFWFTVGTPMLLQGWRTTPWAAAAWLFGFYVTLVGSKISLAVITGRSRSYLSSRNYQWINRGLSLILIVFAVILFRDGLRLLGTGI
jgi:threonine/homoserine/homoserine lactone efflux protein